MLTLKPHSPLPDKWTKQSNHLGVMLQIMMFWSQQYVREHLLVSLPVFYEFTF